MEDKPVENIERTSDMVAVVRCADCMFGKRWLDADGHSLMQCTNPNYPAAMETWPLVLDWYCAGGKRREHEENSDTK